MRCSARTSSTPARPSGAFLRVEDDGVGIPDLSRRGQSLGLLGMRERAEAVGGTFTLERGASGGTTATLRIPRTDDE